MIFLKQLERDQRKSICDSCEHNTGKRCGQCGCFLIALQKIKFSKCPLGKWEVEEELTNNV